MPSRAAFSFATAIVALTTAITTAPAADPAFVRGDANGDGLVAMSDAVFIVEGLFRGSVALACLDAADSNDDGRVDVSDPVHTLSYLFLGGSPPKAPFPGCGADPTRDTLACASHALCAPSPRCEDPAAHAIRFELVRITAPSTGVVRITGVARNLGATFDSRAGQQVAQLYEMTAGRTTLVGSQAFAHLVAGGEVKVTFERQWDASSTGEGEFPPSYVLLVSYDPDIAVDGNEDNDDCNAANNRLERSGLGINDLF